MTTIKPTTIKPNLQSSNLNVNKEFSYITIIISILAFIFVFSAILFESALPSGLSKGQTAGLSILAVIIIGYGFLTLPKINANNAGKKGKISTKGDVSFLMYAALLILLTLLNLLN